MRARKKAKDGFILIVDRNCRITIIYGLDRNEMDLLYRPQNRWMISKLAHMGRRVTVRRRDRAYPQNAHDSVDSGRKH